MTCPVRVNADTRTALSALKSFIDSNNSAFRSRDVYKRQVKDRTVNIYQHLKLPVILLSTLAMSIAHADSGELKMCIRDSTGGVAY